MSKKKRSAKQNGAQKQLSYEAREAKRLEKKHKAYRKKWLTALGCILAAAAVTAGGTAVWFAVQKSGMLLRKRTAMETTHYSVNGAMLAYYFQEHVNSYLSYASSGTSIPCFNTDESLKLQYADANAGKTWYDYIMETTVSTIEQTLKLCEAAYEADFKLTEDALSAIHTDAEATDLSLYQKGIKTADVEAVMTLQTIATEYQKEALGNISVSDDEIAAEVAANEQDYLMFNMLAYTFAWADEKTGADNTESAEEAFQYAEALSHCTTQAEFEAYVTSYETEKVGATAEEAEQTVRAMRMAMGYAGYSEELQKWIKAASPNETYILDKSDSGYYEVLLLLDAPALDTSDCVNLRMIYLPASNYSNDIDQTIATAEALVKQCKTAGGSEAAFAQLAMQYSADPSTAASGGLVEGYSRMRTTYGAETADWAFESGREAGDMFICKRSSAVAVAYYLGKSERCGWENQVYQKLDSAKTTAINEELNSAKVTVFAECQQYVEG